MNTTQVFVTPPLKSGEVMKRVGIRGNKEFWQFVYREGVPHTRLSSRNIVFYEGALNDWLAKRSVGKAVAS